MTEVFASIKRDLEVDVKALADAVKVPFCVDGTGDLVRDFSSGGLVDAFSQPHPFFILSVKNEHFKRIAIGVKVSRILGSMEITIYSPSGQANTGGANVSDFVYNNLHAKRVGLIRLRDVRTVADYDIAGWKVTVLQVSFQKNVTQ